jgi:hypothetical protein
MKIVEGPSASESPEPPWWVGQQTCCEGCHAKFILEENDPIEEISKQSATRGALIKINCPFCENLVFLQTDKFAENAPLDHKKQQSLAEEMRAYSEQFPKKNRAWKKLGEVILNRSTVTVLQPAARNKKDTSKDTLDRSLKDYRAHKHELADRLLFGSDRPEQPLLEKEWEDEIKETIRFSWKWPIIAGTFILGIIVLVMTLGREKKETYPSKSLATKTTTPEISRENVIEASQQIEKITSVLRAYFSATTVDELSQLVRQPTRVRPLMEKYYSTQPLVPNPLRKSPPMLEALPSPKGKDFWMGICRSIDGTTNRVILELSSNQEVKIDWENIVQYQPMDLEEFVTRHVANESLDFRVSIKLGEYYLGDFADETIWRCYQLSPLNGDSIYYGYVKVKSPLNDEIMTLIQGDQEPKLILKLSSPQAHQTKRAVIIEKVASPVLVYLESPES